MIKAKISTYLCTTLLSCTTLANTTHTLSLRQFTEKLKQHLGTFTTLLCEGIYASRNVSINPKASDVPIRDCYALMRPIVAKHIHTHSMQPSKQLTQYQMNKLRDTIARESTLEYLKHHISIPYSIHLDHYRVQFPQVFCKRIESNPLFKPYVHRLALAQCIHSLKPIVATCITESNHALPKHPNNADIHQYGYLVGSCCSIKFVNFFLNRHYKLEQERNIH